MNTYFPTITILVGAALLISALPAVGAETPETAAQRDARTAWWRSARLGMFVHWDMSSVAGTEISWSRKSTRPLDIDNDPPGYVEDPVYDHLAERFNPTKFDARQWVRLAKEAGMKYIVFTAKHHGGFCMWDTKLTDYSIMHGPYKRDVVKELADACHKAGLRFGLYYSPRDWHHPDYGMGDNSKYHAYMMGQLTELLTRYGKVDVLWFDSWGHGDPVNYWRANEVMALVKRLQPGIIVNNRCNSFASAPPSELIGDFDTPEQRLGEFQNDRLWESCITIVDANGGGWSYRTDATIKPFDECLLTLASCATGDGNLLLDVGPNAEGEIPADQTQRLAELGAWMKAHGQSIYGTRGGPYHNGAWGGATFKDKTVYLHVRKWDGDKLELPHLRAHVLKYELVGAPAAASQLRVEQSGGKLTVTLPHALQQGADTVIALHLDAPAADELNGGHPIEVPDAK